MGNRRFRSVWLGVACLLAGCAGSVAPASPASSQPAVTIVAWAVPSTLQVGQAAYLQVKLAPSEIIASGTLSAASADPALTIVPHEIAVKDLHPIVPGHNAPGRSPPEPPALGFFPVFTFQMTAGKPGVYPVEVKFVYGSTVVTQYLTIKGEVK